MAPGDGEYAKEFYNTCTTGISGSIAAIGSLRRSSADLICEVFEIGISKAAGSMQFLENWAWSKKLHPRFAAYDTYLAMSFVEAGVVGAANYQRGASLIQ